jgi:predicted phosphodiesterase
MARYGVISDVHANLEALRAVLDDLERQEIDRIVSLGDVVGYNADPEECISLLRGYRIESIAGNHDLIALGRLGFERCAARPRFALKRTRRRLGPDARSFLSDLPPIRTCEAGAVVLIHGGVDDVSEYLRTADQIRRAAGALAAPAPGARICFYGHTHDPQVFAIDRATGDVTSTTPDLERPLPVDLDRSLYFINPGSVDAARRPRKLAEYAVLDWSGREVRFHRVPYDHQLAERKASAGGYRMSRAHELAHRVRRAVAPGYPARRR